MSARRAALLAAFLLAAGPLHADYKDSFRKGIEAYDRKRWDDVVRHMREAIAGNPTEGERLKLYGLRFEVYLPHFHLGAAYLNQGHCDQAVKAFETSRSQGAIRSHPKYAELLDGLKSCEGQGARATPAPATPTPSARPAGPDPAALAQARQAAEEALARADDSARSLSGLSADPLLGPVWTREPALGPAEREAREALAGARAKLEAGRRGSDLALLAEAREQAGRARDRLEAVRQAAQRRREALARTPPPSPGAPTPPPTAAPVRRGLPPELLAGAQAYFEGRYDDALRQLERAAGAEGRTAAQLALFKAAASYARFREGGGKDEGLRRRATEAVAACRRADPSLVPDAAVFSPSFAAFFRSGS